MNAESDPSAGDDYSVYRGASENDDRLDIITSLQESAHAPYGAPASTGSIYDALRPWQRPPSGHAATYELHKERATVEGGDGEPVTSVRSVWIDPMTKLPLRDLEVVDGETESDIYTYSRNRATEQEVPADLFSVGRPATVGEETFIDYGSSDYDAPTDETPDQDEDAPATQAERVEASMLFRRDFGLNTDLTFVLTTLDATDTVDDYGVPVTRAERDDLRLRERVQEAMDIVRDYGLSYAQADYAGTYIDQEQRGLVFVGFTRSAAEHLRRLKAIFPFPERLRTVRSLRDAEPAR